MFAIITVASASSFFRRAGSSQAHNVYEGATAADALRIAREQAKNPLYHAVGVRVGDRPKSPVLWVK